MIALGGLGDPLFKMTDLKTLGDMEKTLELHGIHTAYGWIRWDELKQEAIKEIKLFNDREPGTTSLEIPFLSKDGMYTKFVLNHSVINYIKWKFDISAEELSICPICGKELSERDKLITSVNKGLCTECDRKYPVQMFCGSSEPVNLINQEEK